MNISEILQKLNEKRKKILVRMLLTLPIILIGFGCFFTSPVMGMVLIFSGAVLMMIFSNNGNYAEEYKETLVRSVFELYFTDIEIRKEGFSYDFVKETKLIPCGNTYQSNDEISGSYQGLHFKRSDVCMQEVVHNGKTTTTTTYFSGSWMVFDFPKSFSSYLCVKEKPFSGGNPGGWFSSIEKFKMENEKFNRIYHVYGSSQHEAFYILTPHFMEKLMELNDQFEGDLCIGFIDNQIHVLIDSREDSFEPPLFHEITENEIAKIDRQVRVVTRIIDLLNLAEN